MLALAQAYHSGVRLLLSVVLLAVGHALDQTVACDLHTLGSGTESDDRYRQQVVSTNNINSVLRVHALCQSNRVAWVIDTLVTTVWDTGLSRLANSGVILSLIHI